MFTYSPPLIQDTLSFGKMHHSLTTGTAPCILDRVILVIPSEARSRNISVAYPPSTLRVRHLSPNPQFLRMVTIYSTPPVVLSFMGYRTPSTDSVLPDITNSARHYPEGRIDGGVKSRHIILPVTDRAKK